MEIQQKTDQSQINRVVWKACDTFRGVIDPSQYKDYILTMLFLKYVSDVYKAKYSEYLNRYEGDKERAARSMRHERFLIPETSSFDYLYQHRTADNIGENWMNLIWKIMISLEMLICIWSLHLPVSQGRKRESSLLRQKFQLCWLN